jgi:hypothetical protein
VVFRKVSHGSIRKHRRARPRRRRTLPSDRGPVAKNLPRGTSSESLPPLIGPYDPPELTPEQLREREELERARRRLDAHLGAPQRVVVVSSANPEPAAAPQPKLTEEEIQFLRGDTLRSDVYREIRQVAFREFGDWRNTRTPDIIAAADRDSVFKKKYVPFPDRYKFERALGRRQ